MMDYTHTPNHFFSDRMKMFILFRSDIRPVPVLAPVSLDPGRGCLQTPGLDLRNVSSLEIFSLKPWNYVSGHSMSLCWPSSASPGSATWPSATPSTCTPWPAPPGQPGGWDASQLKEENSYEIGIFSICFALHCGWSFIDEETDPRPRHIIR